MATLKNTKIDDTGYLGLPTGSQQQRPDSPNNGMIRWNTSESILEVYDGTQWKLFSNEEYVKTYSVTDSTTSTNEGTTITFTTTTENVIDGTTLYYTLSGVDSNDVSTGTSGNFTINNNTGSVDVSLIEDTATEGSETLTFQVRTDSVSGGIVATDTTTINDTSLTPSFNVEYLVVAGGGGGGAQAGGGGGAGGYRSSVTGESSGGGASAESPLSLSTGVNYSVTVGAGGARGTGNNNNSAPVGTVGGDGSNSVFHSITSIGGGGGASESDNSPRVGGSGGGGSRNGGASGTANQGFSGGGGNGGGAGEAGGTDGESGGDGVQSSITGTPTFYAGGGGGGNSGGPTSPGGDGGGGTGASRDSANNTEGYANTGGGGGGGGSGDYFIDPVSFGRAGGSGIVILKYPNNYNISTSGLTASTSTVGANKITSITAGTGTVNFS